MNPAYYLLCLTLPLCVLTMLIFFLMREVIRIILKLKHGSLFGGFLKGVDAVWAIDDVSRSVINSVIIINVKSDKSRNLIEQIRKHMFEKVFKQPDLFPKLTSRRMRLMGFCYLLKNQITVDDCLSTLKLPKEIDTLDEVLLHELISEYSNKPLPRQNSGLWELLVSPKPIQCAVNEDQTTKFLLFLRLNHIVGDGIQITNVLSKILSDNSVKESDLLYKAKNMHHSSFPDNRPILGHHILLRLIATVKHIFKSIEIILGAPAFILHHIFLRKPDVNALHGCKLSGNKILVYAVEKERKLLPLVKKIKESVPDSRFSDILLTAISGSLSNYFKDNSSFTPDFVSAMVTAQMPAPNVKQSNMLQNNFSLGLVKLPILIESEFLQQRLQDVTKQMNKLRNSPDYQVNYWLLKRCCGIIPLPLLRLLLPTSSYTMSVSNVPGISKISILNGCEIESCVAYTPHRGTVGVGITILTYDDRFQLGLIIDKAILESVKVAQSIVDDIFNNITLLSEEVFSSST